MNYKETLLLPKTGFPQKAGLTNKEPAQLEAWEKMDIYSRIRELRKGAPRYVLHDGPPYANGYVHMGTGLNKILKDVVVKYKTMRGYDSPYVPGWDCHGLPIEHKVMQESGAAELTKMQVREKCEAYARKYIDVQRQQFKRLHVFGEWENPYLTLNHSYEAGIIESFARLVEGGYVYKKLKPIHWCMSCETALAEAELEYRDEPSHSVYVRFPVGEDVKKLFGLEGKDKVYFLIWTTTPWTLPANVAIAVGAKFNYVAVKNGDEHLVFAEEMVEPVMNAAGITDYEVLDKKALGGDFENLTYNHGFIDRESRFILADFVSLEDGTGSVHIAPGHGAEDYDVGVQYDLPVISPVDSKGRFTDEFAEMKGLNVFDANEKINEMLKSKGLLLHHDTFTHSYPTCWRCKKPVIFRATEQWFIRVDHDGFREKCLDAIKNVKWYPSWGEIRISSMMSERPDWCVSRQRAWGVPIPALTCKKCSAPVFSTAIAERARDVFLEKGSNSWFTEDVEVFTPEGTACPDCSSTEFAKEEDIFDVWFESGSSWRVLLERDFGFPCDLYLEGSDQHRGWFQLSLMPAVGSMGEPPYRAVLTHGFMVDEEGGKISKSVKREAKQARSKEEQKREELFAFFADAKKAAEKYGADILRLWTASVDYSMDIKLSPEIIERRQGVYRKIRNTFRHLLGNLFDYEPSQAVDIESLEEIDKWVLSQLNALIDEATSAYDQFQFHQVYQKAHNFCVVTLSNFYMDVQKDLLYCGGPGPARKSAQTAMFQIVKKLALITAPILAHTSEEAWKALPGGPPTDSIHLADWPEKLDHSALSDETLIDKWAAFEKIRTEVYRHVETLRAAKEIGSSQQVKVALHFPGGVPENLKGQEELLSTVLIVSAVDFIDDAIEPSQEMAEAELKFGVRVEKVAHNKCERCWNLRPEVGSFEDHPGLCARCREVVTSG